MARRVPGPQKQKRYTPSPSVEHYFREKLPLLKKGESSKKLDTAKVRLLDKIFQGWADLIYFLEKIAQHPELQELFDEDLKDLFDLRPDHAADQLHPDFGIELAGIRLNETAFSRFLFASIRPDEEDFHNYRLRLLHTLQSVIYAKMWLILSRDYKQSQVTKAALRDLQNSLGWTGLLTYSKEEYEKTKLDRIIDFPSTYRR